MLDNIVMVATKFWGLFMTGLGYTLLLAAITVFFVPAICALGYRLGRVGFSLKDHLVYKQNKEKKA